MRKFEGNINGNIYTDKKEFDKALLLMDDKGEMCVSYRYVFVSDTNDNSELKCDSNDNKNYVSEDQYVKNITDKKDVDLDAELINKLKTSNNKSHIKDVVNKKITYFDNKISNNLLHINDLKSDRDKLEEKMIKINNQIKTLDDANNNYHLNKEYYTKINDLLIETTDASDSKNEHECGCGCNDNKCTCGCVSNECECGDDKDEAITVNDICKMSPYELMKYFRNKKVYTLGDLVEYFIKNC
ncbi:MAG: hypothetical protein J6V44_05215 [Methanobrevibacter sp.]|nr:hypothetical protein [Methanobrevibacter sp.]